MEVWGLNSRLSRFTPGIEPRYSFNSGLCGPQNLFWPFDTAHTTHTAALKTTTHPKTRCRKQYAATQLLMLLMMVVSTRNMSSQEYINKIVLLHQVGISNYFIFDNYFRQAVNIWCNKFLESLGMCYDCSIPIFTVSATPRTLKECYQSYIHAHTVRIIAWKTK